MSAREEAFQNSGFNNFMEFITTHSRKFIQETGIPTFTAEGRAAFGEYLLNLYPSKKRIFKFFGEIPSHKIKLPFSGVTIQVERHYCEFTVEAESREAATEKLSQEFFSLDFVEEVRPNGLPQQTGRYQEVRL